jgi:Ca2+:H+ antiporter
MGKFSDLVNPDRYKSQARLHALSRSATTPAGTLPTYEPSTQPFKPNTNLEAGGLNPQHVRGPPSGPAAKGGLVDPAVIDGATDSHAGSEKTTLDDAHITSPSSSFDGASPPIKSEVAGSGDSALGTTEPVKPSIPARMKAGSKRFVQHFKNAIFHSWINVLLVFVPVGIVVKAIGLNATVVFAINAIAIIPLAGLLSHATESVASRLGDTLGALLNVSFGNAVELIIFIIALVKNEIRIVQASLLGSILANLLLILGMAFLLGGLRFREQVYNSTVTQMSACLLSLSVTSLLLPVCTRQSRLRCATANMPPDRLLRVFQRLQPPVGR